MFLYIIDNHPNITSNRFCGLVFQSTCPAGDGDYEWTINIPEGTPTTRRAKIGDGDLINILQFSDIHFDANYKPYGNADCGEPICCQNDQPDATLPENECGYWSDYRAGDTPWHLVEEVVRHAKTQVYIHFINIYYLKEPILQI